MLRKTTAVVLAGGKGTRLEPLTLERAKPAVPFGGNYRIIDFVLSNAINSGLRRILIFTQYKSLSLDRHINTGWRPFFCAELGEFLDIVPPRQQPAQIRKHPRLTLVQQPHERLVAGIVCARRWPVRIGFVRHSWDYSPAVTSWTEKISRFNSPSPSAD